eukprot:scaffold260797_cov34-Tisochrysis_lutea.AAC.1
MYLCSPPDPSITSEPGWTRRWYVLANMSCTPAASDCSFVTPLSAPLVATGTNPGVSITPLRVVIRPVRAFEPGFFETCSISNRKTS